MTQFYFRFSHDEDDLRECVKDYIHFGLVSVAQERGYPAHNVSLSRVDDPEIDADYCLTLIVEEGCPKEKKGRLVNDIKTVLDVLVANVYFNKVMNCNDPQSNLPNNGVRMVEGEYPKPKKEKPQPIPGPFLLI